MEVQLFSPACNDVLRFFLCRCRYGLVEPKSDQINPWEGRRLLCGILVRFPVGGGAFYSGGSLFRWGFLMRGFKGLRKNFSAVANPFLSPSNRFPITQSFILRTSLHPCKVRSHCTICGGGVFIFSLALFSFFSFALFWFFCCRSKTTPPPSY